MKAKTTERKLLWQAAIKWPLYSLAVMPTILAASWNLWIGENIESDSIILTDEYVFSFSGIVKNAIIYPSINTFLPFRIINKELEEYQEEVEKITNSDYKNNNVSLLLNVDDIHRHELNVSNLSKDSIYKLSKLHNSKYFITRKNYENLKLLYKNNLYNIYRVL